MTNKINKFKTAIIPQFIEFVAKESIPCDNIFEAIRQNNIDSVRRFLPEHANDIVSDNFNTKEMLTVYMWTPLIYSSDDKHLEIMRLLIENNARIDDKDPDGWTALHWACNMGQIEAIKLLLLAGAKTDIQSYTGQYAFDLLNLELKKIIENYMVTLATSKRSEEHSLYSDIFEYRV